MFNNDGFGFNNGISRNYSSRPPRIHTVKEYLDWVHPKHHGLIIGKNGATVNEIRNQSGARIKIENEQCMAQGTHSQIAYAKQLIQAKISEREQQQQERRNKPQPSADPNWSCIDFVKPFMMGKVVGKNGETIKSFEEMYGVKLRSDDGKLFVYGSLCEHNNNSAIEGLKELLKDKLMREKMSDDSNWCQLDFIKPNMIGKVIGKNGETVKSFETLYDVKLRSDQSKIFIYGNLEQETNRRAVEGLKELLKDNLDNERMSVDSNWSCIDFVKPEMIGKVIGKNGETIKSFEEIYEVKLKTSGGKLYIYGDVHSDKNKMAVEGLEELIHNSVKSNKTIGDDGWEIIKNFDSKLIGWVIGKQGAAAKKLGSKYGVQIKAIKRGSDSFIAIKDGSEDSREKLKIHLHSMSINKNMHTTLSSIKKVYTIGRYPVTLVESDVDNLRQMCAHDQGDGLPVEKSFTTVPELRDGLITIFDSIKTKMQKMNGGLCDCLVHSGKLLCKKPVGEYNIDAMQTKDFVYQRLQKGDLDFVKIGNLPKIKEYFRYDLNIFTPKPFMRIRYKLFFEKDEHGRLSFISPREAEVNDYEFVKIDTKPGFIALPDLKAARVDIVDPATSNTVRINANIFHDFGLDFESLLQIHLKDLSSVFEQIKFLVSEPDASKMEIYIPDMPDGYVITYLRRSVRKTYRFSGNNLLRTSEERVLRNLEVDHDTNEDAEIIDLFFINENINELLEEEDWQTEEIVGEIENVLKFSDTMLQFLS